MSARTASVRWRGPLRGLAVVASLLLLAGCAGDYPQSTLNPLGDFARITDEVFMTTVWWAVLVFVLVEGALIYTILRFRGKPEDPEPKQVHGNTTAEILWTAIPALILAMIAIPTVRAIFKTYELPKGDDVVEIEIIGHQWWWEYRYPQYNVTTAGDLYVPVGKPVALRMTTQDVLHSFWIPQFAAKRDVFPGRKTVLWFTAEKSGNYPGQCAEFCGIQHARMAFRIVADEPARFEERMQQLVASGAPVPAPVTPADSAAGVRTTSAGAQVTMQAAPEDPAVAQGKQLFMAKGCVGCHSLDATKPMGIGPNLAGIGARSYIAAGWLQNTDENLAQWLKEPQTVKQGVLMPNLGLTDAEATALVAYLRTQQ